MYFLFISGLREGFCLKGISLILKYENYDINL